MSRKHGVLVVALTAAIAAPAAASASVKDYAIVARDIIPSGQYGAVPPPVGATTQAMMYSAITPLFNHVSDAQLPRFFKPETLSTATPGPVHAEMVPRSGREHRPRWL